ncbi:N-acetyllactosaminide beta-1,3-N-acetylglucosaminyltransferase 4-like [Eriocheir sinensis]|uniref:N-acetyllactosaminide beta-1,3-N-acetylglucosaminyltransferase 4-like n=1 Tax=Eriocheir sinensis TaxID=95602 RepID=UPI0021C8AA9D|nr:N-acetyllactosaminide beta-1,3-N-acetylglucosaminyltransferase 4-like [Eriocheir sinensis]XP_050732872.1 N-acetyllactosaminide beta-1,3-N-acetylglucosaminyltransferase 4-like [Eriocheir sinensis]
MQGVKEVPSHHHSIIQRLAVLIVTTVILVTLGDLFYLNVAVKPTTLSSANMGEGSPVTQRHLQQGRIFTKATHERLPVRQIQPPEHELTTTRGSYGKEGYRLTSAGLGVSTVSQQGAQQATTAHDGQFPFRYVINEPQLCANISNLYIINLIATAPQDHENRTMIRRMWGNKMWTKSTGFRTVFLLGETANPRVMAAVREESHAHRDIIQFSFLDSYNNLTLKVLSGLHWVENFCPTPVWVLKSDVDCLVNIFSLARFLQTYDEATNYTRSQFICNTRWASFPCRPGCGKPKFEVNWTEYPPRKFPPYCFGSGYVLPRRMVGPLYQAANKTHPFRLEDVYYTGLLPEHLQWQSAHRNIYKNYPRRPRMWKKSLSTSDLLIMELETYLGPNATAKAWLNILRKQGILLNPKYIYMGKAD